MIRSLSRFFGAKASLQAAVVVAAVTATIGTVAVSYKWFGTGRDEAMTEIESLVEAHGVAILDSAPVPWRFEVREGGPVTELVNLALERGSDTIAVAGRRHEAPGGIAHGSVCSHLLYRWPRSLMIIDPDVDPQARTKPADAHPPPAM